MVLFLPTQSQEKQKMVRLIFILLLFSSIITAQPVKVEIKQENNRFMLYRGDQPFFIKGAAGFSHYEKLKEYGGNSLRVWNTDNAQQLLDKAQSLGLTVTLGLFIKPVRLGFDYDNEEAVQKQFQEIKAEVLKYKDHPALLMWGVGNELELHSNGYKFWKSINEIAEMIHQVDPNHPVTTMLAGVPEKHIRYIKRHCDAIDLLSINAFKDLPNIPQKIADAGWKKPYMISEWGPTGYWETNATKWNAFIEETSTEKAKYFKARYESSIKKDPSCLGSYVFLWGTKQERTHTLFSMFLESGQEVETAHVMKYLWTGSWPSNRAPQVTKLEINGKTSKENIYLRSGSVNEAFSQATDPENEGLITTWAIFTESNDYQDGGDAEKEPAYVSDVFKETRGERVSFTAPSAPGAYRLYVYIFDGHNNVATGNIPFYVNP